MNGNIEFEKNIKRKWVPYSKLDNFVTNRDK